MLFQAPRIIGITLLTRKKEGNRSSRTVIKHVLLCSSYRTKQQTLNRGSILKCGADKRRVEKRRWKS